MWPKTVYKREEKERHGARQLFCRYSQISLPHLHGRWTWTSDFAELNSSAK